jgi:hypothetical protein
MNAAGDNMERPKLVWTVGIIGLIGLLITIYNLFAAKITSWTIAYALISLLGFAWVYLFFQLKSSAKTMLHVTAAVWAIYVLFGTYYDITHSTHNVIPRGQIDIVFGFVALLAIVVFWNIFRIYINKHSEFS